MDKTTIVNEWLTGNLLTAKHDPANLSITWNSYRTVLTQETADNLTGLLRSGEFRVYE